MHYDIIYVFLQGSAAAATNQLSGIELDSLICSVKDLFPDLGDGFIEVCV